MGQPIQWTGLKHYVFGLSVRVCVRLCLDGGILRPAYRRLLVCLSVNRKVVGGFYDIWAADRFLNGRFGLRFRARV